MKFQPTKKLWLNVKKRSKNNGLPIDSTMAILPSVEKMVAAYA